MRITGTKDMLDEAARFAHTLTPRDTAVVVTLSGALGAGKTAFVKGVAHALHIKETVTSPTFVIMKMYPIRNVPSSNRVGFKRLVHIDAYRLKGEHHLNVLGWEELLHDPGNLIFLEWPEKIPSAIPESAVRICFRYSGEHEREITYENAETTTPA